MADDDLRFGDLANGGGGGTNIVDRLITALQIVVIGYVLLKVVEILFNISIPLI